ncbi:MAG: GGDEF domain-containing protein [Thermoproteota archaeon]
MKRTDYEWSACVKELVSLLLAHIDVRSERIQEILSNLRKNVATKQIDPVAVAESIQELKKAIVRDAVGGDSKQSDEECKLDKIEKILKGITELLIELNSNIKKISNTFTVDPLTGLYDRRILKDASSIRSLALIDLDNFKEINDTFGHRIGDAVLKKFANLIKECIEGKTWIVACRYGGDEFILTSTADDEGKSLERVLRNLVDRVAAVKFCVAGNSHEKTISIAFSAGLAFFERGQPSTCNIDNLLEYADRLMYSVKRNRDSREKIVKAVLSKCY